MDLLKQVVSKEREGRLKKLSFKKPCLRSQAKEAELKKPS
jgi:hypothetical protein